MSKIKFKSAVYDNIKLKKIFLKDSRVIEVIIETILHALENNGKIFICGNGGSAADAQHLAAEFMVRLRPGINRKPYPVISLALDTSTLTACSNDYGYKNIFSRPLSALATEKDILIVISTSGKSQNIIEALKLAKKKNIISIGLLGCGGGKAKSLCNLKYVVPSDNVARIQETHIFLGHLIFELVEDKLIKGNHEETL
jgi:D-sedoheptulose 7-phosphate isomerase